MSQPKLHARQKKLLYILGSVHEIVTGKELSSRLGVSERTIRNDIVAMNEALQSSGIFINAFHHKGYRVQIDNRSAFHQLLAGTDGIETKEDRIRHLTQLLIEAEDWLDMGMLEDTLFVSRTTLESDIREIGEEMAGKRPYLMLERSGNMLRFEQDERKQRSILIRTYSENWDYDSREGVVLKDVFIDPENLELIRVTIKNVLRDYHLELDDYGMVYLMLTIAVSYMRILDHRGLGPWQSMPNRAVSDSTVRTIAAAMAAIFDKLCQEWEISPEPEEYAWLTEIASGLYVLNYHNMRNHQGSLMASENQKILSTRLLASVWQYYGLDFSQDTEFCRELLVFIGAVYNFMVPLQTQKNYYEETFLQKYPLAGDIASYICRWLGTYGNIVLGQEEKSFLLPILIVALKRLDRQRGRENIRAVVVSHYNMGITNYIMDNVRYCYAEKMEILGPYSICDRDKIDQEKPSLILTTVKMDVFRDFDAPVIVLSSLVEEPDRVKINAVLEKLLSEQEIARLPKPRESYFHSELDLYFRPRAELSQLLEYCRQVLEQKHFIREDMSFGAADGYMTLLSNGILFWYCLAKKQEQTVMAFVRCRHRVSFEGTRCVHGVIVMIIASEESRYLPGYYRLAGEIAENFTGA